MHAEDSLLSPSEVLVSGDFLLERVVDPFSYRNLFKACELFEKDYYAYDEAWLRACRGVDWGHLCDLSVDEVKTNVIGFLNKWKCRLPYTDSLAKSIKEAHRDSIPFLSALEEVTIQDWKGDDIREVEGRSLTNSEILLRVFSRFVTIGEHFSYVATSKVLHFLEPKLVVMWDNTIASQYHTPMTAANYVYRFIPWMKRMVNEAIEMYSTDKGCSREEAVLALNQYRPPKTIAKLLDEYNYMKFTRGKRIEELRHLVSRPINIGDQLSVRAVAGRDGRTISRAEDDRVILFDNTDPKSVLVRPRDVVKVRVVRVAKSYIIVRVVETTELRGPRRAIASNLKRHFDEFKELKNFISGEGIIEASVYAWMAERRRAKKHYREMFKSENLEVMSSEDFASFLYFRNNRAWTTLYRMGLQLTKNMEGLKAAIAHLQDDSVELASRMRDVLRGGRFHLKGFGKNITSAILHICDEEDRYGVWNGRTDRSNLVIHITFPKNLVYH